MPGGKHWCFTLNNYTPEEEELLSLLVGSDSIVSYLCYGREVGPSGTPHLQGCVSLTQRKTMHLLKDLLGVPRIHLEQRRGSASQAILYCQKDGDFVEFGDCPINQGLKYLRFY